MNAGMLSNSPSNLPPRTYFRNPLNANPTKLPTNCFSVFDHFVKLTYKELKSAASLNLTGRCQVKILIAESLEKNSQKLAHYTIFLKDLKLTGNGAMYQDETTGNSMFKMCTTK